jgi:class 3 adenylate cyclase
VPKENINHAGEIANFALHLVNTVENFSFNPKPELKIKIRVGIHSGMVVGGIVGDKMPRYCLFVWFD